MSSSSRDLSHSASSTLDVAWKTLSEVPSLLKEARDVLSDTLPHLSRLESMTESNAVLDVYYRAKAIADKLSAALKEPTDD